MPIQPAVRLPSRTAPRWSSRRAFRRRRCNAAPGYAPTSGCPHVVSTMRGNVSQWGSCSSWKVMGGQSTAGPRRDRPEWPGDGSGVVMSRCPPGATAGCGCRHRGRRLRRRGRRHRGHRQPAIRTVGGSRLEVRVPPGHGDVEVVEPVRKVPSEPAAADDVGPLHAAFGWRRFSVRRR